MRRMLLRTYLADRHGAQTELANKVGCPPQLMWQWAHGRRPVPVARAPSIELATERQVMRWDLRPDDWHLLWPELIGQEGAPAVPQPAAPTPTPRTPSEAPTASEPRRTIVERGDERRERPGELGGRRAGQRREG